MSLVAIKSTQAKSDYPITTAKVDKDNHPFLETEIEVSLFLGGVIHFGIVSQDALRYQFYYG